MRLGQQGRPNQALQQTAGHDSFLRPIAHRCPAAAELGRSAAEARMELAEAKDRLKAIEDALADAPFVQFHAFEREGRTLHVAVTERLRKAARKEGVWRSREMLATLKN